MLNIQRINTLKSVLRLKLGQLRNRLRVPYLWPHRILVARLGYGSLPDFIIIGVQRGGTTSLYNYLIKHPNVKGALRKEVHFFDLNYQKGLKWYQSFFPTNIRGVRDFITGEASPYYLFHPSVPARVSEILPDVKLIVLLRNPIERAYSHYYHELRLKQETLSFENALARESKLMRVECNRIQNIEDYNSFAYRHYSYLSRGLYIEQLKHWMKYFSRDQFLILKSDDFFNNTAYIFSQVSDFLLLPNWMPDRFKTYNIAQNKEAMSDITRTRLRNFFLPYNIQLSNFLGMDIDDWV